MWKKDSDVRPSSLPADAPRPMTAVASPSSAVTASTSSPRVPGFDLEATRLTPGIQVKGEFSGRTDLFIDGEVQGKIKLPQSALTVGPNGNLNADVEAREIVVYGAIRGNLQGRERVLLGRSSDVTGDVVSQRVIIEEGAKFHGRIDMTPAKESRGSRSESEPELAAVQVVPVVTKKELQ
jgi:cytoskeletal protein CcmA (bactofilin family)